jgi:hypothetical protein
MKHRFGNGRQPGKVSTETTWIDIWGKKEEKKRRKEEIIIR